MSIIYRQGNCEPYRLVLCVVLLTVFLVTCLTRPVPATAIAEDENSKVEVENEVTSQQAKKYPAIEPKETKTGSNKTKWLVIGGAAAIGIGALAIGAGGGGSGSGGGSSQASCDEEPVGPSLAGEWQGVMDLKNYGTQPVSAVVRQCGQSISISTSSSLPYGQNFAGSISSGGSLLLKEGVTYEIWSSHLGPATSNSIRIYDYVNNMTQLDSLKLSR